MESLSFQPTFRLQIFDQKSNKFSPSSRMVIKSPSFFSGVSNPKTEPSLLPYSPLAHIQALPQVSSLDMNSAFLVGLRWERALESGGRNTPDPEVRKRLLAPRASVQGNAFLPGFLLMQPALSHRHQPRLLPGIRGHQSSPERSSDMISCSGWRLDCS